MEPPPYDVVVLAGGRSSRFGSDKLAVTVDGVPLLERVLAATGGAGKRIVVGTPRPVRTDVLWTQERPAGGGPAAGVVAGLELVTAEWVVLLAGDLPYVSASTLERLLDAGRLLDGALLVDSTGRRQNLCSALATAALRRRADARASWHGGSVHSLLAGLQLAQVPALAAEAHDVDVPHDLHPTLEAP